MNISKFSVENRGYGCWDVKIKYEAFDQAMYAEAKHILVWLEDIAAAASAGRIPRQIFSFANYAYGFIKKEEKL